MQHCLASGSNGRALLGKLVTDVGSTGYAPLLLWLYLTLVPSVAYYAVVEPLQLAGLRQELAVKSTELSHVSTSLHEHKEGLARARSQLASVQDNLSGQLRALQRELSATQAEKLQCDREVGRLTQEGEHARP